MNILETKRLYHDFSGLEVLFDVNLQVEEGERHAVIGPNGAGKTTLFNVITGTYQPSRGQVFFKGKSSRNRTLLRRAPSHHWASSKAPMRGAARAGRALRMALASVKSDLLVILMFVASPETTATACPANSTT